MPKNYLVTHSFDNADKNLCVDIIQMTDQNFRFQEWRREPEDISGWFLVLDSFPKTYPTAIEAIKAAKKFIAWFNALNT